MKKKSNLESHNFKIKAGIPHWFESYSAPVTKSLKSSMKVHKSGSKSIQKLFLTHDVV